MLLIKNGYIKPMEGEDLPGGSVLIGDDGKIVKVGKSLRAPKDVPVTVIDAGGRLVTPGLVEAHCHIGLDDECLRWEGADYNEKTDPLTPQMRAIDSIYPQDEAFPLALKGGVTCACTGPGSANVVGGSFAAIKTFGNRVDNMIVKAPLAMKAAFGENPKNAYGQQQKKAPLTRMGTAALLRELLFKTKRYLADKEASKNPGFDMKLEAMIPVVKGELPLKCHAHRADDIMTAVRIGKEFGLKLTLDHCTDGIAVKEELAKEGFPCFIGPTFGKKSKPELAHKTFDTPKELAAAGIPISIITDAPVIPLQNLSLCAGLAVRAGLSEQEGWRAITINPATQTGIGDRVGSLVPGKDGDLVIWNGNPLKDVCCTVWKTFIEGQQVYSEEA